MRNSIALWVSERNPVQRSEWFVDFLKFMGYEYEIIGDGLSNLENYSVLLISPHTDRISDKEINKIETAVEKGMGLITYYENSLFDEKGNKRTKEELVHGSSDTDRKIMPSLGLSKVLGLELTETLGECELPISGHNEAVEIIDPQDSLWKGIDISGKDLPDKSNLPSFTIHNCRLPKGENCPRKALTKVNTAEVLAISYGIHPQPEYLTKDYDCFPSNFVTINKYGDGLAGYIAYETEPPDVNSKLLLQEMLFYYVFLSNFIQKVSPCPIPRIVQQPYGKANILVQIDDIGTDDGLARPYGDPYLHTKALLDNAEIDVALAVVTNCVSTPEGEKRLQEFETRGHEIISHTMSHQKVNTQTDSEQQKDMKESKAKLERILGHPITSWSVPNSVKLLTENSIRWLYEAGYEIYGEHTLCNVSPDNHPVYPMAFKDKDYDIYTHVYAASGWPSINLEFDIKQLNDLVDFAEVTGIPCMAEFIFHYPQGQEQYIKDWIAFQKALKKRDIHLTNHAEVVKWAKAKDKIRLTSTYRDNCLIVEITNSSNVDLEGIAIDCYADISEVTVDGGELEKISEISGRKVILSSLAVGETITLKVKLAIQN